MVVCLGDVFQDVLITTVRLYKSRVLLRTEVPGGGEIGLSSSYLSGFCPCQAEHS